MFTTFGTVRKRLYSTLAPVVQECLRNHVLHVPMTTRMNNRRPGWQTLALLTVYMVKLS